MFESYEELEKPRFEWRKYLKYLKPTAITLAVILFLSWLILPAPYNPQYVAKRVLFNPTAICRDGIYSFSASRSGTCSNHGGVKKWLPKTGGK